MSASVERRQQVQTVTREIETLSDRATELEGQLLAQALERTNELVNELMGIKTLLAQLSRVRGMRGEPQ